MTGDTSVAKLLKRVHRDETGSVSLETILIIGAIALPILIFVLKFGWPRIRQYFDDNMNSLNTESDKVIQGQ